MPPSLRSVLLSAARSALRADSATSTAQGTVSTSAYSGAAVRNDLSGLGDARDSGATARPNLYRDYLTDEELIALLRGTVYRRICELPAVWGTTRGWRLTDDTDDENPLHAEMRRLQVRAAVRAADKWGRALGESRIWMIVDDGGVDLREPLNPARVRRIHRLEVLDRREFTPVEYSSDAATDPLGQPTVYQVHPRRSVGARSMYVHASRLLRFYGDEVLPSAGLDMDRWGADAVGQTLWDGLRNIEQTTSGGARLAQELSVAVFKLAKMPAATGGDQRAAALGYLKTLNLMKSIAQAVMLGPNDDFQRVAANPAGFRDLSETARLHFAMMTGIPMALLFGEAPSGLNTDGASWQASWHAKVAADQDERYRPPLEQLAEVMYHATIGTVPDEWALEFQPLGELSEREKAEIRQIHVQADSIEQMDGVLTSTERRLGRYGQPGGFATELQPVEEATQLPGPVESDPEDVAAVAEMVRQRMAEREASRGDALDDDFRAKRYRVPDAVAGNAQQVLDWREEHGDDVEGMTDTGWARARQLAGDDTVSGQDLIDIAAWFARHGADASTRQVAEGHEDEPWRDAGYVSWLGWGGDSGRSWATDTVERNREDAGDLPRWAAHGADRWALTREIGPERHDATGGGLWIGAILPEPAVAAWQEARAAVEEIVGDLPDLDNEPHVTVLWGGAVDAESIAEVLEAAREIVSACAPSEAEAESAIAFPPGEASGGDWLVVLQVEGAWALHDVHHRLVRRLAHLITARQFPEYHPHITLGYAADLTPEQRVALAELELPEVEWMIGGLEIRHGSEVVAVVPMAGRVR